MRYGPFSLFRIIIHGHDTSVLEVPTNVSGYRPVISNIPPSESDISALNAMVIKLLSKMGHRPFTFGNYQYTRRVFINAVYQSRSSRIAGKCRQLVEMVGQGIDYCARIVIVAWMNDHSRLLIDYQKLIVFVKYIQWNIFGIDFGISGWIWQDYGNHIKRPDFVTCLDNFIIDQHCPCINRILNAIA